MGDRILFLGTGGDPTVLGKQYRATGGIILNIEDNQFHIDPGPGALVMAKFHNVNLRENTAVFVSHNHLNHAGDLNAVVSAMTHDGLDKRGVLVTSPNVSNDSENNDAFLTRYYKSCVERCVSLEAGSKIGISSIDVKLIKTKHSDTKGVGFKFISGRYTLSYTSDTGYSDEIAEEYVGSNIMIINVVNPRDVRSEFSLNTEDAIKILNRIKPRLALITHFGIKMLQSDPLYEAREIQRQSKVETIAAKDGLVISPESYQQLRN